MRQIVQDLHHEDEAGLFTPSAPCLRTARVSHCGLEDLFMLLPHPLLLQRCQAGTDLYARVAQAIVQAPVLLKHIVLRTPGFVYGMSSVRPRAPA